MCGLVVNEKAETGVPGLYAAGDVSCVAKGHLTGAFVFGEIAAEEAARFVGSLPPPRPDTGQVGAVRRIMEKRSGGGGKKVDVRDIEYKMRRLINDYVVSPKNDFKLNRWLDWAERFSREIDEEVAAGNGHELSRLFEIEHILKCATYSAKAALERKESRWGNAHLRTDFPQKDNENFLCHVDIRCGKDGEAKASRRPRIRNLPSGGAR
jgi:succinate dehydrogenase/fumarate reductase flavoprotein subunit